MKCKACRARLEMCNKHEAKFCGKCGGNMDIEELFYVEYCIQCGCRREIYNSVCAKAFRDKNKFWNRVLMNDDSHFHTEELGTRIIITN